MRGTSMRGAALPYVFKQVLTASFLTVHALPPNLHLIDNQ
jgi:hypothetical protein